MLMPARYAIGRINLAPHAKESSALLMRLHDSFCIACGWDYIAAETAE
jgi:hypothetical protein